MCLSLPMRILRIFGDEAEADERGRTRRISLALLKLERVEVDEGDWVLAHTGIAVERIEESDARERLEGLDEGGGT